MVVGHGPPTHLSPPPPACALTRVHTHVHTVWAYSAQLTLQKKPVFGSLAGLPGALGNGYLRSLQLNVPVTGARCRGYGRPPSPLGPGYAAAVPSPSSSVDWT